MLTLLDPETVSNSGGIGANKNRLGAGMSGPHNGRGVARRCLVTAAGQLGLEQQDGLAVPLEELPSVVLACREGQPLLRDSTKHSMQA
jgi:hypothetical protein